MSSALVPLVAAPHVSAAVVPVVPAPATVLTVFPWEGSMEDELRGSLCSAPNSCQRVDQFLWDPSGLATIDATIDATPGTKVVFSYSEGARSVTRWMNKHAGDADAPSPDELSFVMIGNPTRRYGGSDSDVMPDTQYQVIDITRQYDMASDFPDNPLNLIALLNSLAAFTVIHTDYENVDMYDDANIVWKEGNITYVFVPTENLPLLEPLRRLGLTSLADALNEPLKEIVERGYDRSYLPTPEEDNGDQPTLSSAVVSEPDSRNAEPKAELRKADRTDSEASALDERESSDAEGRSTSSDRKTTKKRVDAEESPAATDDTGSQTVVRTDDEQEGRAGGKADSGTGDAEKAGDDRDSSGDNARDGDSDT
ncbi:PE-PPE domain-containing protein [Mycolicibacterium sp. BiH015]|uniref:PE-PPE domain-containing protein n=1 Tax=Mycolicibacterium sp. BiH015 TaxID=3018808 RepID=UPI0022DF6E66|nr:PE-PPE domain-containing protein [Mycolicibacterium sp. BiH015]MDA2893858.1 PE-PPE domain-containing protein [Mycolicibacterium sp. BiH015]